MEFLENPGRDDCNNYAKTAPPTIANGKVCLASFGTRNTRSRQLCVYGLLPDGDPPAPPSPVNVSAGDRQVSLSWPASRDTVTYIVKRSSGDGPLETIAGGLTSTSFTDPTVGNGTTYAYAISSVDANAESRLSTPVAVSLPNPPLPVSVFPTGPGRDLTLKVCSGCHSPGLAAKQHLSPQEWRQLVRFMAAQGAVASDNQLNQITVYLARNFPRQADGGMSRRKEK